MARYVVKSEFIPGTKPETSQEIEDVARAYVTARDERIAALGKEVEQKKTLLALMQQKELLKYDCTEIEYSVLITEGDIKLKVERQHVEDVD